VELGGKLNDQIVFPMARGRAKLGRDGLPQDGSLVPWLPFPMAPALGHLSLDGLPVMRQCTQKFNYIHLEPAQRSIWKFFFSGCW
jgi:hypothetical protein